MKNNCNTLIEQSLTLIEQSGNAIFLIKQPVIKLRKHNFDYRFLALLKSIIGCFQSIISQSSHLQCDQK